MSMNKSERAEMQRLQDELALLRAWRLTEAVEPDLAKPERFGEKTAGWHSFANITFHFRVEPGVSEPGSHIVGERAWTTTSYHSRSRGAIGLHSKKSSALKAGRHELERRVLHKLAEIDKQIGEAEAEERGA